MALSPSYRGDVAGTTDLLTSPEPRGGRGRRYAGAAVLVVAVVAVTLVVRSAGSGKQAAGPPSTPVAIATSATAAASPRTSTPIDADDLITGSLPSTAGVPFGTTAIRAGKSVVDIYCERISSWRIQVRSEEGSNLHAVVLLSPAGPAYPDVFLQIELTWDTSTEAG